MVFVVAASTFLVACGTSVGASGVRTTTRSTSPAMATANDEAQQILSRVELPPGSHPVGHLGGTEFRGGFDVPACSPQTDDVRFWSIPGNVQDVVTFFRRHPTIGTEGSEGYGPTPSNVAAAMVIMENTSLPRAQQATFDVTVGQLGSGHVGIRADAYVAPPSSTCVSGGGAGG